MKHLRKSLALLLALMLAFGIGAPAMAEEIEHEEIAFEAEAAMEASAEIAEAPVEASAVDWKDFYIITHPQSQKIPRGESFTLNIEVNIPDGVEVTYKWYTYGWQPIEGATTPTLQLTPDDAYYPKAGNPYSKIGTAGAQESSFYCKITAIDSDDGQSKTLDSKHVSVQVRGSFWERLSSVTVGPFKTVFDSLLNPKTGPETRRWYDKVFYFFFLLILSPFHLIGEYVENFKELFK